MLTLHPTGNRPLYWQITVRLNDFAVLGRRADEHVRHSGHDPPATTCS